jgi:HD-like signal output (HDOD) protein
MPARACGSGSPPVVEGGATGLKRVLFVDDEESILAGLRNLLRKQRTRWDMVFALGGLEALAELRAGPVDVIVSDMRMPGMDGATLLERVKQDYPMTARIVLSGHAERDAVMRAIPVTHQFLSKPCDAETLRSVVERACGLQNFLQNEVVRQAIGRLDRVPSLPRTYASITAAMGDPNVALADVARIVERDAAMSAKVLQLVNSAFFGLAQRTSSVQQAVAYLGLELLRGLALATHVFGEAIPSIDGLSLERAEERSLLTAILARRFLAGKKEAEEAFTAAIVQDIGTLVLAVGLHDRFQEIVRTALTRGASIRSCEKEFLGTTHAEIGAYLLGSWGLPLAIVETVAHHHTPGLVREGSREVLAAVHVANVLAESALGSHFPGDAEEAIDLEFLEQAGLADRLPKWKAIAEQEIPGRCS